MKPWFRMTVTYEWRCTYPGCPSGHTEKYQIGPMQEFPEFWYPRGGSSDGAGEWSVLNGNPYCQFHRIEAEPAKIKPGDEPPKHSYVEYVA